MEAIWLFGLGVSIAGAIVLLGRRARGFSGGEPAPWREEDYHPRARTIVTADFIETSNREGTKA